MANMMPCKFCMQGRCTRPNCTGWFPVREASAHTRLPPIRGHSAGGIRSHNPFPVHQRFDRREMFDRPPFDPRAEMERHRAQADRFERIAAQHDEPLATELADAIEKLREALSLQPKHQVIKAEKQITEMIAGRKTELQAQVQANRV